VFPSTRPHGARPGGPDNLPVLREVSIHAPTRGATMLRAARRPTMPWFQSTRPHGARLQPRVSHKQGSGGFNPRAHTGRDTISIPTSGDGLTFQSTRPHGARPAPCPTWCHRPTCFNPRAHTGRDADWRAGATPWPRFNPRAHTGRDPRHRYARAGMLWFQSTRPHGARLNRWAILPGMLAFQSTRPHGARPVISGIGCWPSPVSIHAPTRGATDDGREVLGTHAVSIHAPTRGATTTRPSRTR